MKSTKKSYVKIPIKVSLLTCIGVQYYAFAHSLIVLFIHSVPTKISQTNHQQFQVNIDQMQQNSC